MNTPLRLLAGAALAATLSTQAHAAIVTATLSGLATSSTPHNFSSTYTGTITFTDRNTSLFTLAGINPVFGGAMAGTAFDANGSFVFTNGVLTSGGVTVTSGLDMLTLTYTPGAAINALPLNSFNVNTAVTASIFDGGTPGLFGTIALPDDFFGSGLVQTGGQNFQISILSLTGGGLLADGSLHQFSQLVGR